MGAVLNDAIGMGLTPVVLDHSMARATMLEGVSASVSVKYWSEITSNLVRVILGEIPEALSESLEPYRWSGG